MAPCSIITGMSLCSGAGGLDLGLRLAIEELRTICYVEREAYAASLIVARMEDAALDCAPVWDDISTFDGRPWRGLVDIVHGGYPCQPFSIAGRKLGDKDPRHLWPHVARIVREVEPRLCFFENVGGHLRLGFEQVHDDLRSMGYRVAAGLFTAEEVGASHKRERLFILAYAEGAGNHGKTTDLPQTQWRQDGSLLRIAHGADGSLAYRNSAGFQDARKKFDTKRIEGCNQNMGDAHGARLEGRNSIGGCSDELPAWPPSPSDKSGWERYLRQRPDLEPAVCRMADGMAYRVDRLRLCGNGVVPLVAAYAFRTLSASIKQ